MEEQQLEAMILRNFLLVQADKHGHHLLASLPTIAGEGGGGGPEAPPITQQLITPRPLAVAAHLAHIKVSGGTSWTGGATSRGHAVSEVKRPQLLNIM
jgi:hypothetical protein